MAVDDKSFMQDAVLAFQNSNTGQGKSDGWVQLDSDQKYIAKYRDIRVKASAQLSRLLGKDAIRFGETDAGSAAHYDESKDQIVVDSAKLKQGAGRTPLTEDNLGTVSLSVVHEAVHAALAYSLVEEEMACRILAGLYGQDLLKGVEIKSLTFGKNLKVTLTSEQAAAVKTAQRQLREKTLVDDVLANPVYSVGLTAELALRMVMTNLWGGVSKRTAVSKGIILKKLAESRTPDVHWILVLLESVRTSPDWKKMMSYAMDQASARTNLKRAFEKSGQAGLQDRYNNLRRLFSPWP